MECKYIMQCLIDSNVINLTFGTVDAERRWRASAGHAGSAEHMSSNSEQVWFFSLSAFSSLFFVYSTFFFIYFFVHFFGSFFYMLLCKDENVQG